MDTGYVLFLPRAYEEPVVVNRALVVGVEFLYNDPRGFAKRDPEYFKFVVGVLDGTL